MTPPQAIEERMRTIHDACFGVIPLMFFLGDDLRFGVPGKSWRQGRGVSFSSVRQTGHSWIAWREIRLAEMSRISHSMFLAR
jgi:hypothetical protein